jgi:hypothetical protein
MYEIGGTLYQPNISSVPSSSCKRGIHISVTLWFKVWTFNVCFFFFVFLEFYDIAICEHFKKALTFFFTNCADSRNVAKS